MWLESRYSLIKEGVLALRWTEKPGGWLERKMDGGRGWRCGHVAYYFSPHGFSSLPVQNHTLSQHAQWARAPQDSRFSPEPQPRPGGGRPFQHHSQSKCHLLLTCKTLTIPPPGAAITNGGERILMGYAIKKRKGERGEEMKEKRKRYSTCSIFYRPCFPFVHIKNFFFWTKEKMEKRNSICLMILVSRNASLTMSSVAYCIQLHWCHYFFFFPFHFFFFPLLVFRTFYFLQ